MMRSARFTACVSLLVAATTAAAQERSHAGEWGSYRDAYRAMVVFDKYGGAKSLLQHHLQIVPKEKGLLSDAMQLILSGKTIQTSLPLDATGRTVLPLLKAAYDDNAVLIPTRRLGGFTFRPRVSLAPRADGAYDVAELRAGCAQALGFARYADASAHGRQCAGVRLVFPKKGMEAAVRIRRGDGVEQTLVTARGPAFPEDMDDDFQVVTYRFGTAERAQLVTYHTPLAIVPLFE